MITMIRNTDDFSKTKQSKSLIYFHLSKCSRLQSCIDIAVIATQFCLSTIGVLK